MLLAAALALVLFASDSWAQAKHPRVGVLTAGPPTGQLTARWLAVFRGSLAAEGWVEGQSVTFEMRNAGGDPAKFAVAAAELVRANVDVIYALGAPPLRAAAAATSTIPIVGVDYTNDPVAAGYAQSYGRPGGNVTGIFVDAPEFSAKWLDLMRRIVPNLSRMAIMSDPSPGDTHLRALKDIAQASGIEVLVVEVRRPEEIDAAASAVRSRQQAMIILPSPMIYVESKRVADLTLRQRIPGTTMANEFAELGGLLSYGPEWAHVGQRAGVLVAKVLRGAKPGDLPIERPTKYELIVNLRTAKALNIAVPESVLAGADPVIR
jgi:putative ABC transport system substrate-binding protein